MWIEPVEARRLMAGNVTVAVVRGQLRITGDDKANVFQMFAPWDTPIAESFLEISGAKHTSINGKSSIELALYNGSPSDYTSIVVNTGSGDDRLTINGSVDDSPLRVDMGAGDDRLLMTSYFAGAADFYGGGGQDQLDFVDDDFSGRLQIFPGDGFDAVGMSDVKAERGFDLTDDGADSLEKLKDVTAGKASVISTSSGPDTLSIAGGLFHTLHVYGGAGNNVATITSSVFERDSFYDGGPSLDDTVVTSGNSGEFILKVRND